eukprot:654706-Rhodomonas_salina.5
MSAYAIPGTDIAYADTSLRVCCAMSRTDIANAAARWERQFRPQSEEREKEKTKEVAPLYIPSCAMPFTGMGYQAAKLLRDVRY